MRLKEEVNKVFSSYSFFLKKTSSIYMYCILKHSVKMLMDFANLGVMTHLYSGGRGRIISKISLSFLGYLASFREV